MNEKLAKQIRQKVKKKSDEIKIQAMQEFIEFSQNQSLKKRIIFALRIVLKKMNV